MYSQRTNHILALEYHITLYFSVNRDVLLEHIHSYPMIHSPYQLSATELNDCEINTATEELSGCQVMYSH